ncbi:hypothetical protein EC973_007902 [Apophysomyces ossiformis]|uniref:Uncharacterized protein n=1 Tax=Apophysomyces ossiformis TaxID=679940 RepID=A0A8H7BP54_9FUNG|nr:hypothetical protein EC973_007902 [Apophysomyces ossiformis]
MSEEHDHLISRLNAVAVSSSEETLTKRLNKTHLATSSPATSAVRSFASPVNWSNESAPPIQPESEDGWGSAPSYTAISQGTYFGFASLPPTNYISASPKELNHDQPFARFKNTPVSFLSAIKQNKEETEEGKGF